MAATPAADAYSNAVHELEQLADAAERLAGDAGRGGFVERLAEGDRRALRVRGDPVHRRVADAALRRVHHAPPAHLVVGVHERAEVREQVLDLAAVVELHAADDAVRNAGAHELLFDDAALRVGAVEDRDVAEAVVLGFDEAHRSRARRTQASSCSSSRVVPGDELAADLLGPQLLRAARRVVGDHRVRGVEDPLRRAVVLLEHDHRRVGEHLLEPHDVPEVRPAELVDRLIRVSHDQHVAVLFGEHAHELPLGHVGVLELVDQHLGEAGAPAGEHVGVLAEQAHGEHEQVVEVDR